MKEGDDSKAERLRLCLVHSPLSAESQASLHVGRMQAHSYIGLTGNPALLAGAFHYASHHYVFPLPQLLAGLQRGGRGAGGPAPGGGGGVDADELAACVSLQRGNNDAGRAREYLDCTAFHELFHEKALDRELRMLRDTLSVEELSTSLAARFNVSVRKRGPQLWELDFSALVEGAKLGLLGVVGGEGGGGPGRRRRGGKVKPGDAADGLSEMGVGINSGLGEESLNGDSEDGSGEDEGGQERGKKKTASRDGDESPPPATTHTTAPDNPISTSASGLAPGALFSALGEAVDTAGDTIAGGGAYGDAEEEVEGGEEEREVPWTTTDHPIFSKWFAMLNSGMTKAAITEAHLIPAQWNPSILDLAPGSSIPPTLPATAGGLPAGEWTLLGRFKKMASMGLPRPVIEHAMSKESLSATLLDGDPTLAPLACKVCPPHVVKGKKRVGPAVKKFFWTPAVRGGKGKVEGTFWGGAPGDLIAASKLLIKDTAEFGRFFVEDPGEAARRKAALAAAAAEAAARGVITLFDPRRAQNAAITLSKLSFPTQSICAAISSLSCKVPPVLTGGTDASGRGKILSPKDLAFIVALAPTPEELSLVKGFKGDIQRLGPPEKFALATSSVAGFQGKAVGLLLQVEWDERVGDVMRRAACLREACAQVRGAPRFQRLCKAVLVLGNKMNFGLPEIPPEARPKLCRGFTLSSLAQLSLTKSWDGSISVMTYLHSLLRAGDPDILDVVTRDFSGGELVGEARRLPMDAVKEELGALRDGLTKLEGVLRAEVQSGGIVLPAIPPAASKGDPVGALWEDEEVVIGSTTASSEEEEERGKRESAPPPLPSSALEGGGAEKGVKKQLQQQKKLQQQGRRNVKRRKPVTKTVRRRVESLPAFVALAQIQLVEVKGSLDAALKDYSNLLEFMKEEEGIPPDEFFSTLWLFLRAWETELIAGASRREKKAGRKGRKGKGGMGAKGGKGGGSAEIRFRKGDAPDANDGDESDSHSNSKGRPVFGVASGGGGNWGSAGGNVVVDDGTEKDTGSAPQNKLFSTSSPSPPDPPPHIQTPTIQSSLSGAPPSFLDAIKSRGSNLEQGLGLGSGGGGGREISHAQSAIAGSAASGASFLDAIKARGKKKGGGP